MCCLSVKSYVASIRDAPAQECHEFPVSSWGLCVVFPVSGSQAFLVLFFVPADFPRACVCVCVRYRNASLAFSRSGRWLVEGRYGYGYGYAMLLVGVLWVLPMLALALLSSDGDGRVGTGWRLLKPHGHPDRESTGQNREYSHLCVKSNQINLIYKAHLKSTLVGQSAVQ